MYKNMHKYLSASPLPFARLSLGAPHSRATFLFTSQNPTEPILGRTKSVNILCWNEESVICLSVWRTLRNFIVIRGLMNVLPDAHSAVGMGCQWNVQRGRNGKELESPAQKEFAPCVVSVLSHWGRGGALKEVVAEEDEENRKASYSWSVRSSVNPP